MWCRSRFRQPFYPLRHVLTTVAGILLGVLITPRHADAQIYAWRDANGTLVLSDRNINAPTDVYTVEGAPTYRTTRPAPAARVVDQFDDLVLEHSTRQALRPELVRAVIQVESGFNPLARSPKGAMGLMQLMPRTAATLGVRDPFDPAENIRGGTAYLRQLLDRYDGDEALALAAYNAGSGAVDRHGRQVPPYRETRDYVRKVGSAAGAVQVAARSGGALLIYKSIEVLDGRAVPRYSTQKPTAGTYEIIRK
jgi:soluble lytic murein transglycosylase-like protein